MHSRLPVWSAGLVVAVLFALPAKAADAEPSYDGKRLSEWVKQLKSGKEEERKNAAEALGSLAVESQLVVPALLEAVVDGPEKTNQSAVSALIKIGPAALPTLSAALWDDDRDKRHTALFVLGRMGEKARPVTAAVLAALADSDAQNRCDAVRTLGLLGNSSAVPALLPLLDDKDSELRDAAAGALMDLRTEAKLLVPAMIK
jgi:HEAT repeat protein